MHIPQTETLKITYFLQPCARRAPRNPPNYIYSQSVGIIYPIFFNILEFGICPQSRMSSKSHCPQSRMSSKSRPQSRVLKVVCPHCPIVVWICQAQIFPLKMSWSPKLVSQNVVLSECCGAYISSNVAEPSFPNVDAVSTCQAQICSLKILWSPIYFISNFCAAQNCLNVATVWSCQNVVEPKFCKILLQCRLVEPKFVLSECCGAQNYSLKILCCRFCSVPSPHFHLGRQGLKPSSYIQGVFFNWCPPKSSKCQIT